jgi:hypothetical protein
MSAITKRMWRIARRFQRPLHCSACHLPRSTSRRFISGPGIYICESCVASVAASSVAGESAALCSFCRRPDAPIAGTWPDLAICARCVDLSRAILAEDDRGSRHAT